MPSLGLLPTGFSISWEWLWVVVQSCPTLCDPVDCRPPGSSVNGILQVRILEWVAISFSRGSSQPRDRTQVSHIAGRCFNLWATREASHGTQIQKERLSHQGHLWKVRAGIAKGIHTVPAIRKFTIHQVKQNTCMLKGNFCSANHVRVSDSVCVTVCPWELTS